MNDTSTTSAPVKKPSRFGWWLSTALLAFSGGMIANPWFESQVRSRLPESLRGAPGGATGGASATMAAQVAALENRVTAVEARPGAALPGDVAARISALEATGVTGTAGAAATSADIAPLDQRLASVEGRIATAEAAAQAATQAAQTVQTGIVGLDSRVAAAQAKADRDGVTLRAMAAAMALRATVEQGRPLGGLDDTVALLVGSSTPDMITLRRIERGGPTLNGLRQSFRAVRPALTAETEQASGDVLDKALGQLRALVAVKSANTAANPTNRTPDAMLPLVDERLARGDIAGTAAAIRLLPAAARNRANAWLAQADAYVATRAALARLEAQTVEAATRIAAAPPPLGVVSVAPAPVVSPPTIVGGGAR
jgi:hypothetical protein